MKMDKLIARIAALGIPGLILFVAISATGFAGAAAITAALAALGGPLGMLGGIAVLGLLVVMSNGITEFGFGAVYKGVVNELKKKGLTETEILKAVDGYPISAHLKRTLKDAIQHQSAS